VRLLLESPLELYGKGFFWAGSRNGQFLRKSIEINLIPKKKDRRMSLNHYFNLLCVHSDLDGIANVVLAQYFDLPFDKIVSYDYDHFDKPDKLQVFFESDNIIFSDISPTLDLYDRLISIGKTVRIFDHHESSLWIKDRPGCVHDNFRSGTKIFFEEYVLRSIQVPRIRVVIREFVEIVSVYDLWQIDSPLRSVSEDLQRVFVKMGNWDLDDNLLRHDRFVTSMLRHLQNDEHFGWNNVELMHIRNAKISEDKAYNEALAMLQIRKDNENRKFGVLSMWGKISMVCHRLLNVDRMDVSYIVVAQKFHNVWGKMSFRSREGEFDLMDLAGVAGHKSSAGAELTPEDAHRFLDENLCFKYKKDLRDKNDQIIEECLSREDDHL
jgi:oligoribonuclease NrnB/cAMP/cGMP phosphodiesterase (DHH superfamily)